MIMRAIKYKYALQLNMSVSDDMILDAIEQATEISNELQIDIRLQNLKNGKEIIIKCFCDNDIDKLVEQLS